MSKKILLVTDNQFLLNNFRTVLNDLNLNADESLVFHYRYSHNNLAFKEKFANEEWIKPIRIKDNVSELKQYSLIFSLHCKQLFPAELVNNVRCINIHPGLNPYNRGWFPQVFSIINGLPAGATIHEIDEKLDHGGIIAQKGVPIEIWDTSISAYEKILDAEIELLKEHLPSIIKNTYKVSKPKEGNLNLKKDFNKLCRLDLEEKDTFLNHINKLRALTHGDYANAYFFDEKGNKVFIKVELSKEDVKS